MTACIKTQTISKEEFVDAMLGQRLVRGERLGLEDKVTFVLRDGQRTSARPFHGLALGEDDIVIENRGSPMVHLRDLSVVEVRRPDYGADAAWIGVTAATVCLGFIVAGVVSSSLSGFGTIGTIGLGGGL